MMNSGFGASSVLSTYDHCLYMRSGKNGSATTKPLTTRDLECAHPVATGASAARSTQEQNRIAQKAPMRRGFVVASPFVLSRGHG